MSDMQIDHSPVQESAANWREMRRTARHERRILRRQSPFGAWIGGATLIIIGLAFLLQNSLDWSLPDRWWALFLLIPALSSLAAAWQLLRSQKPGQRRAAFGALVGGSILLTLAIALFLSVNLQLIWPLTLVAIGISTIISRRGMAVSAIEERGEN
ncbi:MAG: hypothetical protein KDE50_33165 [Caldilineaceae bacterium]|nr:hypothetical protein [Caldilineaceae bacterium]MCB8950273.1 hypothetical protein [Ardenticatenaceae bacterium]